MSFVFTWMRLSSNKVLTWARRSSYQSKDIAWMQKVISQRMTDKVSPEVLCSHTAASCTLLGCFISCRLKVCC
jgi:cytochrome b subunit of formate dehydrogenase